MFTKLEGTLMSMKESPDTRFQYTVWFDYTRESINGIQEGTMLAVPNFGSSVSARRWSILEVIAVMPSHFALQSGNSGYPGFVVEAARSAAQDWESQERVATEETTKIEVTAIPTFLELVEPEAGDVSIAIESNMAMVGSRVRSLDSVTTNRIANNGIDRAHETSIAVIGCLARDKTVDILIRIEELIRTHFAIFGFTGVGKSNLLSTAVAKVFESAEDPTKLVFFDLMGEYSGLLIDQLLAEKIRGQVLTIGRHTLPEGVYQFINELPRSPSDIEAAKQLLRYTLLPKALQKCRTQLGHALLELLRTKRVRFFNEAQSMTVFDLFFTESVGWSKERRGPKKTNRQDLLKTILRKCNLGSYKETRFSPPLAKSIRERLESELEGNEFAEDFTRFLDTLRELESATSEVLAAGCTLDEIVEDLNDRSKHSLWIIQAHNPSDLRSFAHALGNSLYERRRLGGLIEPLVSFVFDEADEFIRSQGTGSYELSAEIAQTIARRGRKFGIGLGIATQRIRYLDTNIMSQPHTYFISKLPRASDRTAVAEAFGFGNEMLNQTFKFSKGQWLLVSHDATGLEAIPLPVKTPNANERLEVFLNERFGQGGA